MKIDFVLTACNLNYYYLDLFPYVYKVWKNKFGLELILILISETIPEQLKEYENNIILFKPIQNINSCYIAQVIRILYPSLFENKNILITDIDIVPISTDYFFNSVENYQDDVFISYTDRYLKNEMLAICYNLANSNIWKKIFNISSIEDINNILIENYKVDYNGTKNCDGWYSDQKILYSYVFNYKNNSQEDFQNKVIILNDNITNYNRLDGKGTQKLIEIKNNKEDIINNINLYSDFHIIRNYHKNLRLFENIIDSIMQN